MPTPQGARVKNVRGPAAATVARHPPYRLPRKFEHLCQGTTSTPSRDGPSLKRLLERVAGVGVQMYSPSASPRRDASRRNPPNGHQTIVLRAESR